MSEVTKSRQELCKLLLRRPIFFNFKDPDTCKIKRTGAYITDLYDGPNGEIYIRLEDNKQGVDYVFPFSSIALFEIGPSKTVEAIKDE